MPKSPTVQQLQSEIAAITGRPSASNDIEFLQRRLANLKRKGAKVSATRTPSIVMAADFHDAAQRVADRERLTLSQLVRKAIAEYASRHSHAEAQSLKNGA